MSAVEAPEPLPGRVRVLVADDEPDMLELVSFIVSRSGHEVVPVGTGRAALAVLRQGDVDVAVLDVQMPSMTGLEVMAALEARPGTRRPALVLMSALSGRTDVDAGYAAGADVYLTKPFRLAALRAHVDNLVEQHRSPV